MILYRLSRCDIESTFGMYFTWFSVFLLVTNPYTKLFTQSLKVDYFGYHLGQKVDSGHLEFPSYILRCLEFRNYI